jgi:hypothetical protein
MLGAPHPLSRLGDILYSRERHRLSAPWRSPFPDRDLGFVDGPPRSWTSQGLFTGRWTELSRRGTAHGRSPTPAGRRRRSDANLLAGTPDAAALQSAKRWLLEVPGANGVRPLPNPFFRSRFILIGEGARSEPACDETETRGRARPGRCSRRNSSGHLEVRPAHGSKIGSRSLGAGSQGPSKSPDSFGSACPRANIKNLLSAVACQDANTTQRRSLLAFPRANMAGETSSLS